MAEDKISNVVQEERIVLNNDCIDYVMKLFPATTHDQVREAIEEAGPVLKDIVAYAKKKYDA